METLHVRINKTLQHDRPVRSRSGDIRRIVLIDGDDKSVLAAALIHERYDVVHCTTVRQAWDFVYPHPPQLIILHLDGFHRAELADLEECWALAEGVPIILATSAAIEPTLADSLRHRTAGILSISPEMGKAGRNLAPM